MAMASFFPLPVLAQSQPLKPKCKKLIHVDTDIAPLGATPFPAGDVNGLNQVIG